MLRLWIPLLSSFVLTWPALAQQVAEGPEPNQSTGTATVLPCGRQAGGTLANASDADWYQVVLAATTDLRLETAPGTGVQAGDTTLVLLDATGAPLQASDNGIGAGYYSRLYARGLPAGTYYAVVESGLFAAASGSYTLDVRCVVPVTPGPAGIVPEGPENNDPRTGGTATTISLPARCNGVLPTVGGEGDWDFYRVLLLQDGFLRASVQATATHPTTPVADDLVLYLFDASTPPVLLAGPFYATDFGVWDTAIEVRLAAGAYQLAIRCATGSIGGRYYLDVSSSAAAALTVNPGGCSGRVLGVAVSNVGPGAPQRLERPVLGTTYVLRGSGLPGNGIVLHVVGFLPTLIDLTPFGAIGCFVHVAWIDTPLLFADAAGEAAVVVPLPEVPALLGATLESQLAVLDFSNPLGLTTSNSVSAVIAN